MQQLRSSQSNYVVISVIVELYVALSFVVFQLAIC